MNDGNAGVLLYRNAPVVYNLYYHHVISCCISQPRDSCSWPPDQLICVVSVNLLMRSAVLYWKSRVSSSMQNMLTLISNVFRLGNASKNVVRSLLTTFVPLSMMLKISEVISHWDSKLASQPASQPDLPDERLVVAPVPASSADLVGLVIWSVSTNSTTQQPNRFTVAVYCGYCLYELLHTLTACSCMLYSARLIFQQSCVGCNGIPKMIAYSSIYFQ